MIICIRRAEVRPDLVSDSLIFTGKGERQAKFENVNGILLELKMREKREASLSKSTANIHAHSNVKPVKEETRSQPVFRNLDDF